MTELTLNRISLSLAGNHILKDVSCTFSAGTTVLVGRNGAGKTSLMNVLAGLRHPNNGEFSAGGLRPFSATTDASKYRRILGWVPQAVDLPPRSRTGEFVEFCAWLGGVDAPLRQLRARAEAALDVVQLQSKYRMPIAKLSGGQQRRVMIACALVTEPKVLLLDEPTAGLDPDQRDHLHSLLNSISATRTTIVSTHLLEDVLGIAQHVVTLDAGRIIGQELLDSLLRRAHHPDPRQQMRNLRACMYG